MTVVFDAGQNSAANLAHLAAAGLGFVGSIPPSDCTDLLARPATDRHVVDPDRFPGVTALEDRRRVFGADRRVVLTHSPSLHTAQTRGFDQTMATATAKLSVLGDTLARGHTRRARDKVTAEITHIVKDPWVRRVVSWQLTGDTPAEHRLSFDIDDQARTDLETEVFGKRVLMTDRDQWSTADVVAGYRSQSEAEFGFRQLKDPHVVSFSPMHHWTEHNIRVHVFTCVLDTLAGIQETVLIYPSTGGRPKARRMLTETTTTQDQTRRDLRTTPLGAPTLGHRPKQDPNLL